MPIGPATQEDRVSGIDQGETMKFKGSKAALAVLVGGALLLGACTSGEDPAGGTSAGGTTNTGGSNTGGSGVDNAVVIPTGQDACKKDVGITASAEGQVIPAQIYLSYC